MAVQEDSKEITRQPLTLAEVRLTSRELLAYRTWKEMAQPRLSPDTQARFFALFLKGESIEEICRLNRGFSLGQVCFARVEGEWDEKRDMYLQDLLTSTRAIVQQTALESIRFVADVMAAAHKKHGEAARRYIQTGDEADLKGFAIDDLRAYKTAVETLQKLTGQENKVQSEVTHHHRVEAQIAPAHRPLNSKEASNIVKLAANKVKK